MEYVRAVDFERAEVRMPGGYRGQYLYAGESCFIIATKVPSGARGPGRHVHTSDQTYVVLEGEIDLSLGARTAHVDAGSAVFIPAGLPHENWNGGSVDEIHLEVIAPGVSPVAPVAEPSELADAPGLEPFVSAPDRARLASEDFVQDWFVNRRRGASHAAICLAEVAPSKSGPPLHVHEFDQFYFVLSGMLSVEVGFSRFTVEPNHLVVLPAQVPHRQWNEGVTIEQHLTIIAPEPMMPHSAERPWDVAVLLAATGETIA